MTQVKILSIFGLVAQRYPSHELLNIGNVIKILVDLSLFGTFPSMFENIPEQRVNACGLHKKVEGRGNECK